MPDLTSQTRAMTLLMSVIPEQEHDAFKTNGTLTVRGSAGGTYQLSVGRSGNVLRLDDESKPIERICIHPREIVPNEDTVVAQMLMLWSNEPMFLAIANRHHLGQHAGALLAPANQHLCATVAEFVQQIVERRQARHTLVPHDDPYTLCKGFQDTTANQWMTIRLRPLCQATNEDVAALGLSASNFRMMCTNWREFACFLGYEDPVRDYEEPMGEQGPRYQVIENSLETLCGRQALSASLTARFHHGGLLTHSVYNELARIWQQILEHAGTPDESPELEALSQLMTLGADDLIDDEVPPYAEGA